MSIPTPSLFSVWTVPVSQLELVETLCASFFLNLLANNISNLYSVKSFFSVRNVLGYVIPLVVQIAIVVGGIAIIIGKHRVIPKVLGQYLHLFVYCCTDLDYEQLKTAMNTWRTERQEVNADDKHALNDITDRAWRMRELQSRNLLVRIFKSEGNDIPRRSVSRFVIHLTESPVLALLATAPATFAINMLSSDMSNSLQHKPSWVLVLAYLAPLLVQITMTVAFRVVGKRKMNRKMFEYLQELVKGWEDEDYGNVKSVMECWREHRGAGLAGDKARDMILVYMERGGDRSPLGRGLSSLPPRSDDGSMEALSTRGTTVDDSCEMDIMSPVPSLPERRVANEQQEAETGTLSSAQGDSIAEEMKSSTMPPSPRVNVTDEKEPLKVLENGTVDRLESDQKPGLRQRRSFKIKDGGPSRPQGPQGMRQINDSVLEWYSPDGVPKMEIIFFPGLQLGDLEEAFWSTWVARGDRRVIWPKDWLPRQLPTARILSVSYKNIARRTNDAYLFTENLLSDLRQITDIGRGRPVFLVGHSIGGLVIKNIILRIELEFRRMDPSDNSIIFTRQFIESMKGAFFYATPNVGFDEIRNSANLLADKSPILDLLQTLIDRGARISDEFRALRRTSWMGLRTHGIGESLPVNDSRFHGILVSEASARIGVDGFNTSPDADHFTVCQAKKEDDARVIGRLTQFIADCLYEN